MTALSWYGHNGTVGTATSFTLQPGPLVGDVVAIAVLNSEATCVVSLTIGGVTQPNVWAQAVDGQDAGHTVHNRILYTKVASGQTNQVWTISVTPHANGSQRRLFGACATHANGFGSDLVFGTSVVQTLGSADHESGRVSDCTRACGAFGAHYVPGDNAAVGTPFAWDGGSNHTAPFASGARGAQFDTKGYDTTDTGEVWRCTISGTSPVLVETLVVFQAADLHTNIAASEVFPALGSAASIRADLTAALGEMFPHLVEVLTLKTIVTLDEAFPMLTEMQVDALTQEIVADEAFPAFVEAIELHLEIPEGIEYFPSLTERLDVQVVIPSNSILLGESFPALTEHLIASLSDLSIDATLDERFPSLREAVAAVVVGLSVKGSSKKIAFSINKRVAGRSPE